jgi:hypothetical protein
MPTPNLRTGVLWEADLLAKTSIRKRDWPAKKIAVCLFFVVVENWLKEDVVLLSFFQVRISIYRYIKF